MEYNYLFLNENKLYIEQNESFIELSEGGLYSLKAEYSLISNSKIKRVAHLSPKVLELLKTNKVVINFEKVSSALKELEGSKIINHLNRENFRKISFPIYVRSEYLKNYLKGVDLKFELSSFLENSNFQEIELDS